MDWLLGGRFPWYTYLTVSQNFWMAIWNKPGAAILAITWAFALEVQFYLIVPAIIRFVRKSALPYVFASGIAAAPIVRLFIVYKYRSHLWATYLLLPSRMDSLFLGLLCAYFLREPGAWNWLVDRRKTLWILFLVLLAGIPILCTEGVPLTLLWITAGYGWASLFYATALVLTLTNTQGFLSRAMRVRWLMKLGRVSYGVYLYHYGIYGLCMWLLTGHGNVMTNWKDVGATSIALVAIATFSIMSWRYFERPIVRWSHTWTLGRQMAGK